jgi:hypothetical protein
VGNGRWRIVLPEGVRVDVIWQLAGEEELLVRHLSQRRDSLEQIFLKAVGHIERDSAEVAVPAEEGAFDGRL